MMKQMTIDEIVHAFTYVENLKFPKAALDAAIKRQDEITPVLLAYIQLTPAELLMAYDKTEGGTTNLMWDFSMHLLGQFRCQQAFEPIVNFFTHKDSELVDRAAQDFISETLPMLVASTFNGDSEQLLDLMTAENVDIYVQNAFFRGSLILYKYDEIDKQSAAQRYRALLDNYIQHKNIEWASYWVAAIADLAEPEFEEDIEAVFNKKLVDLTYITPKDVAAVYKKPPPLGASYLSKIDDTYFLMKGWSCFTQKAAELVPPSMFSTQHSFEQTEQDTLLTLNNKELPKVGRNEPCPCGSGKKFKKCCLS